MKSKITNRSQVYRAIYYSGFDWSKSRTAESDTYKLVDKSTSHTIYMEHKHDNDLGMDIIEVKTTDNLVQVEIDRFTRLCYKIKRRTKNLGIHQDIFELAEEQQPTKETENA